MCEEAAGPTGTYEVIYTIIKKDVWSLEIVPIYSTFFLKEACEVSPLVQLSRPYCGDM